MKKRTVEVFTAGCPLCDDALVLLNEMACPSCEVVVHDLAAGCETDDCREKARQYGVTSVPAVVVDGELAACCRGGGIDRDALRAAGVGVAR